MFCAIGLLRWDGSDNNGVRSCDPQEMWGKDCPDLNLEWDIPFRELGFSGVPHRCAARSGVEGLVPCLGAGAVRVQRVSSTDHVRALSDAELLLLSAVVQVVWCRSWCCYAAHALGH